MPTAGTRPTQYRLPDDTLDQLDRLAAHYALPSRAAAIRYAAAALARATWPPDGDPAKKGARKSRKGP